MPQCMIEPCENEGDLQVYSDFADARADHVYILGPYAMCEFHADSLGTHLTEVHYPDGRVEQRRQPGQPAYYRKD
jgi:hypothetical protein